MKIFFRSLLALVLVANLISCSKDDDSNDINNPTEGLVKIAENYAPGAASKVELWAESNVQTGYNRLYVLLTDSSANRRINRARVSLHPMMKMSSSMSHSSPFENPESETAVNELFPCAVAFTMPGAWTIDVEVENLLTNKSGKVTVPVSVAESKEPRVIFATSEVDQTKYIISYINPSKPKTGLNDLELLVSKQVDMMNFPPATDLEIGITPEMPDMGHGSPNNLNPVHKNNGHYIGKVNFTMTGYWKLNLTLKDTKGPISSSTPFFNVTF